MSDGWLPNKYERMQITSCTGPGTMYDGYAWAIVLHCTESPPGSIDGINSLFRSKPCSAPHFCIDPMGTRRRMQYIPWSMSACALKGGREGWQTNRGRAVQVEICGYARESPTWDDDCLYQIADWIVDCIADGVPINPHDVSDMSQLRGTLATEHAPQRMSPQQWKTFGGITAHVEIPFNDHWDCGSVNSLRIRDLVLEIMAGQGRPIPPPTGVGGGVGGGAVDDGMLREGMSGGIVMMVQQLIIGMGYDCGDSGADGMFGPATTAAVKRLQADHGLDADGIVGPATNAVISAAYDWARPTTPPLPPPQAGTPAFPGRYLVLQDPLINGGDVQQWQTQMAARGWRMAVDAWYGQESASVCKTFQAEKGLQVDAVVGPSTWRCAWEAPIT